MSSLRTWLRGSPAAPSGPSSTTSSLNVADNSAASSSTALSGAAAGGLTPGWASSSGSRVASSVTPTLTPAQREAANLQDAMEAAGLIMNDDIEGAEARLRARLAPSPSSNGIGGDKSDQEGSSFHQLGLGVSTFMRSVLGFEKDIMAEASARLADCENRATADQKKAQKSAAGASAGGGWFGRGAVAAPASTTAPGTGADARVSQIYPPGTEYALVHAEAQLMSAVISVLHESLTEGIKGFMKLRKAYIALDAIMQVEAKVLADRNTASQASKSSSPVKEKSAPAIGAAGPTKADPVGKTANPTSDEDLEFVDAAEGLSGAQTPDSYTGHLAKTDNPATEAEQGEGAVAKAISSVKLDGGPSSPPARKLTAKPTRLPTGEEIFSNPVDSFIHSGASMCFGILLLIISMVPPAFSRLLSIIGFRGDRERGLRLLWRAAKYPNVNGAVAGLAVLGFYNGMMSFADILPVPADIAAHAGVPPPGSTEDSAEDPDDEAAVVGYPAERCAAFLKEMRHRYPDSGMWQLEEARVMAASGGRAGKLPEAIELLRNHAASRMRQVTALNSFELSMNAMFAMDWPLTRDSFLRCVELNDWSHAMYFFLAGCAELEMYRDAFHRAAALAKSKETTADGEGAGDERGGERSAAETEARKHKKAAEELFRKVPTSAGRKRFMARQMPLEVFVVRKVAKWEERAAAFQIDLADAVAASPAQEMVWIWNGAKRMDPGMLERALKLLSWDDRCTGPAAVIKKARAEHDEAGIESICEAALFRGLGRLDEARKCLERVVAAEKSAFRGPTRDDYVQASAHYELAVLAWVEGCEPAHYPPELRAAAAAALIPASCSCSSAPCSCSSPSSSSDSSSSSSSSTSGPRNGDDEAAATTKKKKLDEYRRGKVDECHTYLDMVARWEGFVLDARVGMRVQTAMNSVRWLRQKKGWPGA